MTPGRMQFRNQVHHRCTHALRWSLFIVLGALVGILTTTSSVQAREDRIPGSRYVSGRAGALGDTLMTSSDLASDALFYNPASLGQLKGVQFEPFNLVYEANNDMFRAANGNLFQATSLATFGPTLKPKKSVFPGVGLSFFPNGSVSGFAFGLMSQASFAAQNYQGLVSYRTRYDLVPAVGYGASLAHGIIKVGYSLQWVQTAGGSVSVPDTTKDLSYNRHIQQGSGFSHTAGVSMHFPFNSYPSVHIVARNIGDLHYNSGTLIPFTQTSEGAPATEKMTFDTGFSIKPRISGPTFLQLSFVGRDMGNQSNMSFYRRSASSIEISGKTGLALRGGFSGGYPSAGLGYNGKKSDFSLSWTSVLLPGGSAANHDSRFMMQIRIRLF